MRRGPPPCVIAPDRYVVPALDDVIAPDELVPCAATTVARLPGTLFVTERHVCFESESTSGDGSDEGRKAPSRRLVLAHDEILGATRSKTEGWIRVEVEVKTPEVEVRHSGRRRRAGGERGERVSVRKSATFSGFGGDAETEGALAPSPSTSPRRSSSASFGVVREVLRLVTRRSFGYSFVTSHRVPVLVVSSDSLIRRRFPRSHFE